MSNTTILLVEDTKSIIDLVNLTLSERGYSVSIATNGIQALKIAPRLQPSLILLDILMPEMDGYETCRLLKLNDLTKNIPVIFLSALTKTFDKVKAFKLGGVDFISKPIETEELIARVDTHLTISRLQNELKNANEKLEEKVSQRTLELQETNKQLQTSIANLSEKTDALQESEERYRLLVENIMYPVIVWTFEGELLYINDRAVQLFGIEKDELSNFENKNFWVNQIKRKEYINELKTNRFVQNKEAMLLNNYGESITAIVSSNIINYYGQQAILSIYNDITKLKQLEMSILTNTIEVEEKERQHFAQELHDGIGPLLSTVKMYIQWILKPESKADKTKTLEKVHDIVCEAHETIRQISFSLSPHVLQNFGLLAALRAFTDKVKESTIIAINVDDKAYNQKDTKTETIIYRILTECITNTLKHAEATEISIIFERNEKKLQINYSDNGKGFIFDNIKHTGLGLLNMQSRLQSINGKLEIDSTLGSGTKIQITIIDSMAFS